MTIAEPSSTTRSQPVSTPVQQPAPSRPVTETTPTGSSPPTAGEFSFDGFQPSPELGHEEGGFEPGSGPNLGAWDSCPTNLGGVMSQNAVNSAIGRDPQAYQGALDASGVTMHSGTNPSGSLYVIDDFLARNSSDMGTPSTMPHGYHVAAAAHQQNPEAQIIGVQDPGISEIQQRGGSEALYGPTLPPEEARAAIGNLATQSAIGLNTEAATNLRELTCDGVTQSVANFSTGTNSIRMATELYRAMQPALSNRQSPWTTPEQLAHSEALTDNVVSAFSLDRSALSHPDNATRQQAQADLLERLTGELHQGFQSQDIEPSRAELESAVTNFEALGNSVVIAAGNDTNLEGMYEGLIGAPLDLPAGAADNVLRASGATMVGAASAGGLEPYSNPGSLNASGTSPLDSQVAGSSFAAPRVAAEILAAHLGNANLSSDQAVVEVTANETQGLQTAAGELRVLQ